ncbi:MAG: hypothetical protein R3D33_05145 [Hyphomicrobiaceae bacterium]
MSKSRQARNDILWLVIAFLIFAGALGISVLRFGEPANAGNSCTSSCRAQLSQCLQGGGSAQSCKQAYSSCVNRCVGG